jgi:LCP family protein required for cell wall assembly
MIPNPFMADDGEKRPSEPPDYKVYRARKGLLSRLRKPDLPSLREREWRAPKLPKRPGDRGDKRGGDRTRRGLGVRRPRPWAKRALKWLGLAAGAWILLSFLAFAVSAQLQSFKLSGEAKSTLHGNPLLLFDPQTILVIGTDARPPDTKEPGAAPSQECFDQQSHGDVPHGPCSFGEFRADTLMLIRAGRGAFRKLSIPRDAYAEIPGQNPQEINGAFAFGGAGAQIEAVEDFLEIEVDHVAIVDFTGFEALIDAVGGVEVDVPVKICADISGGAGGGQGGGTVRLAKGENTLSGEKALIYSRIRKPTPCPGPGPSAYSLGYDDFDRAAAQQAVISGIKGRLTDPLRLPYNFVRGPIIGWEAPKAFVSDMGFLTMPQLILAAAIGGDSQADVLCQGENSGCGEGPSGSIEVPESERRRAVKKLLG